MLGDCITTDGNPRDPYLNHILSSQSSYQPRDRVPSPYSYNSPHRRGIPHQTNTNNTPHFSPRQADFSSPQHWTSSTLNSSPESLDPQHRNGVHGASAARNHQMPSHQSPQSHHSPSYRLMMDSRPGTLYQSLRSPQYSPSMSIPAFPDEGMRHSNPNQQVALRREKGKKNLANGTSRSSKLATDMRRCACSPLCICTFCTTL